LRPHTHNAVVAKGEALEAERRPRVEVHRPAEVQLPPRAVVEAVHQLAEVRPRLPAEVEVARQLESRPPVAAVRQPAGARRHPPLLAADVAAQRGPEEAAVPHRLPAALHQVAEGPGAATRTETPMTGGSISKSVGPPLGGATTEESGTARNGAFGAGDGTSTAWAGVGCNRRSVSFGFAEADRCSGIEPSPEVSRLMIRRHIATEAPIPPDPSTV
jgi:hypothetical protein